MTDNPYPLAGELAKPVAAGKLNGDGALAALLAAAVQHERLTGRPATNTFRLLRHLYRDRLDLERQRLAIAAMHQRWEAKRHGR